MSLNSLVPCLQIMPLEILLLIFSFADISDIMELSIMCRSLYRATETFLGDDFSISLSDYTTLRPPDHLSHTIKTFTFFTTVCRFRSLATRTKEITAHVLDDNGFRPHFLTRDCEAALLTIPFSDHAAREKITRVLDDFKRHTSLLLTLFLCHNLTTLSIKAEISLAFIQDLSSVIVAWRPHPELRDLSVEWARWRRSYESLQGYDLQDVRLLLTAPKLRTASFVNLFQSSAMNWSPNTRLLRGPKLRPGEKDSPIIGPWATVTGLSLQHCVVPASWPLMLNSTCLGTSITHLEFSISLRKDAARMLDFRSFAKALNRISNTLEVLKVDMDLPLIPFRGMIDAVKQVKWDFLDLQSMDKLQKLVLPWFWWTSKSGQHRYENLVNTCVGWKAQNLQELVLLKCEVWDIDVQLSGIIEDLIAQRRSRYVSASRTYQRRLKRIEFQFALNEDNPPEWMKLADGWILKGRSTGIDISLQNQNPS